MLKSVAIILMAWSLVVEANAQVRSFDQTTETEHFSISWRAGETSADDASKLAAKSEDYYIRLKNFLGNNRTPAKVKINLEGPAFNPTTKVFSYPSVDKEGTVHLFQFPGQASAYSEGMPHELVHAFRTTTWKGKADQDYMTGFGFVEEGIAEFVSVQVAPEFVGFVRYGFPLQIVVGALLEDGRDIPMNVLFDHHEINAKCIGQAYPLRASFFRYLYDTFGKEKVFQLAYYDQKVSRETFKEIFGASFDDLVSAWRGYAMNAYKSTEHYSDLKKAYFEKTPISRLPVCSAGSDW